ncbi:MAG: hypothetical protein Q4C60_00570 [Eubacteriales bacterium]|nr:hypothetical protein [Eubacteriales bacterium]
MTVTMIKKMIRALAFIALAAFCLNCLSRILCFKSEHGVDQARYLYVQPRGKIDVLFLGSSRVHCNVDPALLWEEQGMAAYLLTGAEQPLWNSYHGLVEALKTQKPEIVVLDMYCPAHFYDDYQETWLEQNLDGLRISWNKWQAIQASTQNDRLNFLLGYTKYHFRYSELTAEDFSSFLWNEPEMARWKGYAPLTGITPVEELDVSHISEEQPMTEKSQYYFDKIVELTRQEGIQLALICAPYQMEEGDQRVYNAIEKQAEQNGLLFLNTNTTEHYRAMGLDFSQDFADASHLNTEGSRKYTGYLGKWLKENYEISDRRGEAGYESWEEQE